MSLVKQDERIASMRDQEIRDELKRRLMDIPCDKEMRARILEGLAYLHMYELRATLTALADAQDAIPAIMADVIGHIWVPKS